MAIPLDVEIAFHFYHIENKRLSLTVVSFITRILIGGKIIMARAELVEHLNKALSYELAAVIQYSQHSYLITGPDREVFKDWFRDQAEEAQDHAETLGDKIVALGGIPAVEPAMIRQSTELKEMLKQDLELEREALAVYMEAWAACDDNDLPQKFWLEGQISDEQMHVEELEKLTSERTAKVNSEKIVLKEL
jgi:bacterioferritin